MPAYTPTTVADCIALINSYIVDNNTNSITPAKFRGMMLTLLDFMQTAIAAGTTPATPTINAVLAAGNLSNNNQFFGADNANGVKLSSNLIALQVATGIRAALTLISGHGALELENNSHLTTLQASPIAGADLTIVTPPRAGTIRLSGDQTAPTISLGSAAGTGAIATFGLNSDDRSGTINLSTGTSPSGTSLFTVTYHTAYPTVTRAIIQIANGTNVVTTAVTANPNPNNITVVGTLAASSTYTITYHVEN